MRKDLTWTQPKLERLDVAELTQSRGFGRDRDDRDDRGGRPGYMGRGRRNGRDES